MKKTAIALLLLGCMLVALVFFINAVENAKMVKIFLGAGGFAFLFLGFSFFFTHLPLEKRRKRARVFLFSGISVLFLAVLMKFLSLPGANASVVFSLLFITFSYLPLFVFNRYEKWKAYTRKKWHALLLSGGDLIGLGASVLGLLFRQMHWPGGSFLLATGSLVLLASVLGWNMLFSKEIVLRKEAEEKVQKAFEQLSLQHQVIEEKNKEIMDSIHYAKRIQRALITSEFYIKKNLNRLMEKKKDR